MSLPDNPNEAPPAQPPNMDDMEEEPQAQPLDDAEMDSVQISIDLHRTNDRRSYDSTA